MFIIPWRRFFSFSVPSKGSPCPAQSRQPVLLSRVVLAVGILCILGDGFQMVGFLGFGRTSTKPTPVLLAQQTQSKAPSIRSESPAPDNDPEWPLLVPLEGSAVRAKWDSGSDGIWVFRTPAGQTLSLSTDQLIRWGTPGHLRQGPVVVLADGTFLVGRVARMAAMLLEVEPDLLVPKLPETCRLPLGRVVGVVYRLPVETTERDRLLDRLHKHPPDEDRLLLLNGDELAGRVEAIEEKTLRLVGSLGPMSVPLSRIRAVQFRRLPPLPTPPSGVRIWVGLHDGSLLLAENLSLHDGSVQVTLPGRLTFQADKDEVVFLQPLGARIVYLSDLEPADYRFEPFFDSVWPYQRDRNVLGGWLRSGGRRYLKGLGVHSKATLKYSLAGLYSRLDAELALDDSTAGRGGVIFRVLADGKPIYQSAPICGGDPPQTIRLDLSNVQELELVVDYGPRGDEMDRANWLDARLIRISDPKKTPSSQANPTQANPTPHESLFF